MAQLQITIGNTLNGFQAMKHQMREPQGSFTKMSVLQSLFKLSQVL